MVPFLTSLVCCPKGTAETTLCHRQGLSPGTAALSAVGAVKRMGGSSGKLFPVSHYWLYPVQGATFPSWGRQD